MLPSRACASLMLIAALLAIPAAAQQSRPEPAPPPGAPPGAPGTTSTIAAAPGTVINNTFNPTGPTGTGTFSPTASFIVCVNGDGSVPGQHSGMTMSGMMAGMAGHVEGRIAFLKAELKITDPQTPLWNAVAAAMREQARVLSPMPMTGGPMKGTLPERLAAMEKTMAAHTAALHKLKEAVDPLYAALAPEQKKSFDELTADMGGGAHP